MLPLWGRPRIGAEELVGTVVPHGAYWGWRRRITAIAPIPWAFLRTGELLPFSVLLASLGAVLIYRWMLLASETAPPGSDGGGWLAASYELFGTRVKAATEVYPPVTPLLLKALLLILPPLSGVKVLGLLASVAGGIPVYWLARLSVNGWLSILFALTFILAGYQVETLAFGGYPQLLGTAFLLFSLYFLCKGLMSGGRWYLSISGILGALALGSNGRLTYQLVLVGGIYLSLLHFQRRGLSGSALKLILLWTGVVAAASLALFPFYYQYLQLLAANPTNPHGFSVVRAFMDILAWRIEFHLWLLLTILAVPVLLLALLLRWSAPVVPVALSLVVGPAISVMTFQEVRDIQLAEAGVILSVATVVGLIWNRQIALPRLWLGNRAHHWMLLVSVLVLAGLVGAFGHYRARAAFDWYRVVDSPVLEALDWLRANGTPGALVVANEAPRGGIYGWWIEGYAGHPTYNAADPRWFIFKDGKVHTSVAAQLLNTTLEPNGIRTLAEAHGIHYLFLDKRTIIQDLSVLYNAGFTPGFENQTIAVLVYGEIQPNS